MLTLLLLCYRPTRLSLAQLALIAGGEASSSDALFLRVSTSLHVRSTGYIAARGSPMEERVEVGWHGSRTARFRRRAVGAVAAPPASRSR